MLHENNVVHGIQQNLQIYAVPVLGSIPHYVYTPNDAILYTHD